MTTTYNTTFGLTHTIIPLEPSDPLDPPSNPSWSSVKLDMGDGRYELNGYRIEVRYYVRVKETTSGPPGSDPTVSYKFYYPDFRVTDMTLVKTSPSREVFVNEDGTQLFTAPPGPYSNINPAVAGITDGSEYSYFKVFDEANVSWLPRCGTIDEDYVTDEALPVDPQNEDDRFPKYPMDALSAFMPDMRESVGLTYTITTSFESDGWEGDILLGIPPLPPQTGTRSQVVGHTCTQDTEDNWGAKLKSALNNCYFTNNYYHVSLYENDEPKLYDNGEAVGDVKEPEYDGKTLVNTVYDYGIRPVNGPFIPIEDRTPDD
jgi:hypothetical protein